MTAHPPSSDDDAESLRNWAERTRPPFYVRFLTVCDALLAERAEHAATKAENERLNAVLDEINELRSNIIATQSASWSNALYPLVAILNNAGFTLIEDRTDAQKADHMACYGGAGGTPRKWHE